MKHIILLILLTLGVWGQEVGVPFVPEAIPENTTSMIVPKGTYISHLSYLEKKKMLIAANSKGVVSFITLSPLQKIAEIKAHDTSITAMTVTPDEKYLITAGQDAGLKLWEIESKQFLGIFETHGMPILGLVVTPDSKRLITVDACVDLVYWDLVSKKMVKKITVNSLRGFPENTDLCVSYKKRNISAFRNLKISHDGRYIAIAGNPWLIIWDIKQNKVIRTIDITCKYFNGNIEFSMNDKSILFASQFKPDIDGNLWCGTGLQLASYHFLDNRYFTQILPMGNTFTLDEKGFRFISYSKNYLGIVKNFQSDVGNQIPTNSPPTSNIILYNDLFMVGFDNGVIKFYDFFGSSMEKASLFLFDDNEWIAIRENGHFDISTNARSHIKMLNNKSQLDIIDNKSFQKYNTKINLGEK
jgi:WD40 repeat protein